MDTKNRQKMLLIVVGVGLVLLGADRFVFSPLTLAWKVRAARIAQLKTSVSNGSVLLSRERSICEQWEGMRTNTLPENVSLAETEMLKGFERWAQQSGVSVSSIKPQWRHYRDEYRLLECRADISGSIGKLAQFLFELETDPMALKVEAAELSARDNEGQQLALALQVSGLVLTPAEK